MIDPAGRKPDWLKVKMPGGDGYRRIDRFHRQQGLNTVCRSAACPNQAECWASGTATFMILGDRCTRGCAFCNIVGGEPLPPDPLEAQKVAEAIAELKLSHAVITSVTRDDLPDGGAAQFASLIEAIRTTASDCRIELLIPDLGGDPAALEAILTAGPDILGHNLETVPRLYAEARQGADYRRSLELLRHAAAFAPQIPTKSGLMFGLGETDAEIAAVLVDLLEVNCRLLTLGQYLRPTRQHLPVMRYPTPDEFDAWRDKALAMGFSHVESGPLVRSSYHAREQFESARG